MLLATLSPAPRTRSARHRVRAWRVMLHGQASRLFPGEAQRARERSGCPRGLKYASRRRPPGAVGTDKAFLVLQLGGNGAITHPGPWAESSHAFALLSGSEARLSQGGDFSRPEASGQERRPAAGSEEELQTQEAGTIFQESWYARAGSSPRVGSAALETPVGSHSVVGRVPTHRRKAVARSHLHSRENRYLN